MGSAREENVDKTIVIQDDKPTAPPPEEPDLPDDTRRTRSSVFSDLSKLLFHGRLTVVDDTITPAVSGGEDSSGERGSCKEIPSRLTDLVNHYAVDSEPLATGGQGSINRAVDHALGCEVAVKSLHQNLCGDEHARSAFLNEAKVTASLDHPAIIPIHGLFGDGKNGMHLAMKLIRGRTFSRYLKDIVTIYTKKGIRRFDEHKSLLNRLEIFLRVCDAVEYAHSRNIIHRDLKLENIMIGKHRETYVTDWGIAMNLKYGGKLNKITGTPGFIAPEVLTEHRADTRSDIYSLGVILFELVTLTPAFNDSDLKVLLHRVRHGMHAPLEHRFGCHIDPDLAAIIRKAMQIDPEKRYQTVTQFSGDVRRYLAGEETSARPDSLFSGICRWGVQHRRQMLFSTMTVMLLGIASIAYTLQKEIRHSTVQRYRDGAASSVYGEAMKTSNGLERSMNNIEVSLGQLRMNILFSALKIRVPETAGKVSFVPLTDYINHPPATLTDSEAYRHRIDPYGVCVFNVFGKPLDMEQLKYFGNTASCMRNALLGSDRKEEAAAVEKLLKKGSYIKKVYFTLTDGTLACYPGSADDFPPGYDPTKRVWYQRAMESRGIMVWSEPYKDSGVHGETVITCSTAISGADGKFIGVAAFDFSLTKLAEKIFGPERKYSRFTYEKLLIKTDGEVIFRMASPEMDIGRIVDKELIRKMLRMRHGTLTAKRRRREMLLVFSYLKSIDVLYVECLDMAKVVKFRRQSVVDL